MPLPFSCSSHSLGSCVTRPSALAEGARTTQRPDATVGVPSLKIYFAAKTAEAFYRSDGLSIAGGNWGGARKGDGSAIVTRTVPENYFCCGVTTFNFNKAVKRNIERFPEDFMFRLTAKELESLIFQTGISKKGRGGSRYLPYAFTEQGVAMLSSVLRSKRAIEVNIQIMRTFVKLKEFLLTHAELSRRLDTLERRFGEHDEKIQIIFEAIKKLLEPVPEKPKRQIGFGA